MGQDEKDRGPDGEQEPEPEAPLDEAAAAETVAAGEESPFDEAVPAAPPPQAARRVSVRPPLAPSVPGPEITDDGQPELGAKSPRRYSRRGKIIFLGLAVVALIAGAVVGVIILFEQYQAKICAESRRTNDPAKIRECWNCSTQLQWRPTVLHRIANGDQVENLDLVVQALQGEDSSLAKDAANTLLYIAQSPNADVRAKVAALKDSVIKKRMKELESSKDREANQTHALLGLTLVYMEDVDGLAATMVEAPQYNFAAYSEALLGWLANQHVSFFEGVLKLADKADGPLMTRILGVFEKIDYSSRDSATQGKREKVIALLNKVLSSNPDPDVEVSAILCWAETGDEGALRRVAEYFDRAAVLENADAASERQQGADLARRAEQLFGKVKLRYGAEKLVDLYRLIKKNRHRQERILYLIRQLHDPRPKVRDFLVETVEFYAPPEGDFGLYLNDRDQLNARGSLFTNSVFALAELLDERAVPHLRTILNKFSTMVKITDEQANLYNAGLLILGSIAVRNGPPLEDELARYIFELSDPDKYPERWTEKRAGKLRVLSFIAGDLWERFLKDHPECRDDMDPLTTLPKKIEGCVHAVDLHSELPPPPGEEGTPPEAAPPPPPPEEMSDLDKELAKRAERLREFTEGEKTLDDTKHEELRWVFDTTLVDLKAKVYYFTKVFSCPIEITMDAAMMDRNDPRVKAYERWCGDYSPATESMARLAHSASASFQSEARQYLADRLGKEFLRYPGTQESIQYDQYMNKEIYNFVMFRQAVAKSLGYLGTRDPKLLEALKTVVFDESDHPQIGRYAGVSLGIIADGPTLLEIIDAFTSPDTHPDVRGYLLKAIDGHFRFAPLNDLAPEIPDAETQAIDKLSQFLATYEGGLAELPSSRFYLLGVLFGSMATNDTIAGRLAELTKSSDSHTREVALLALICSASRTKALPIFEEVFGKKPADGIMASLRSGTTLKTLRDVFTNVGTPNDPYTVPVRSRLEVEDETLFRRLDVLHTLQDLGQKDYLDYYIMRLALALGVDKTAMDKAQEDAGLEAADSYTPIAYKLSYKDNFTYYETPYLTWTDALYKYAADPDKSLEFRKYAVELLWRIDERGYVYSIYQELAGEGRSEDDKKLHDYVYETVMQEFM